MFNGWPDFDEIKKMAGAGGIEPPDAGIKIRCLTAWRRPNAVRKRPTYSAPRNNPQLVWWRKCENAAVLQFRSKQSRFRGKLDA